MEGEGQFTELVFGRLSSAAPAVRERLLAEGWVSAVDGQEPHAPRFFRKALGKESSVACLDESDRTFLLVRTVVR